MLFRNWLGASLILMCLLSEVQQTIGVVNHWANFFSHRGFPTCYSVSLQSGDLFVGNILRNQARSFSGFNDSALGSSP